MGKGDKKSKRGKIIMGSFGVNRPRKRRRVAYKAVAIKVKTPKVEVTVTEEVKKVPKKVVAKKPKKEKKEEE